MAGLRALAASTLLLAVPAVPAAATPDDTTFVVNSVEDDGDLADDDECEAGEGDTPTCTLRAAIEQASNGTGATITFDPSLAGETIEVSDELLATQPIVLEGPDGGVTIAAADDFEHDSVLVVRAAGSAVRDVAFDGNDVARGLHVAVEEAEVNTFDAPDIPAPSDPDLLLDGATATNGYADGDGGGILVEGPLVAHLQDVVVSDNEADSDGGGLAVIDATLTIDGLVATTNIASSDGGGVYLAGVYGPEGGLARVGLTEVSGNRTGSFGGGFRLIDGDAFVQPASGLDEFLVVDNTADSEGGGLHFEYDATATVTGAHVEGNAAPLGGGAAVYGWESEGSTLLRVEDSVITANDAVFGGGVHNMGGGLILRDADVVENTADSTLFDTIEVDEHAVGFGGGVGTEGGEGQLFALPAEDELPSPSFLEGAPPGTTLVLGGTIADNTAVTDGGGIHAAGQLIPVLLRETRVTGNTAGGDGAGVWTGRPDRRLETLAQSQTTREDTRARVAETPRPEDVLPAFPASLDIRRSDVSSNTAAGNGGGIASVGDYLHLSRSSVTGNVAGEDGGAIWHRGIEHDDGQIEVLNEATRPYVDGVPHIVAGSTLSGNEAGGTGGGLYAGDFGLWALMQSTLADNTAATGPAMHLDASMAEPTDEHDEGAESRVSAVLLGSIVADHEAPACTKDGAAQYYDPIEGQSGNVLQDEGSGTSSCQGVDMLGVEDTPEDSATAGPTVIVSDAGLTDLVTDADVTSYHLLEPTSPAIDLVTATSGPVIAADEHESEDLVCLHGLMLIQDPEAAQAGDQRLAPNPVDGDGDGEARCDSGAVEFQGAVAVTATTDGAEPSTDGSVTISRTGPVDTDMVVPMTVTGTATPGADYVALPASVTIPAGESDVVVPVEVIDDELDEDTETVEVTITRPEGTDPVGGPLSGTVAIVDDDVPSGPGSEAIQLGGPTRIDTAVAVSNSQFEAGSSPVVLLATARVYADALAASPLAGQLDASLLLTEQDHLPGRTADEIERLGSTRAIILGGTDAVSAGVADDLTARGLSVDRIGGADRFVTATLIFERLVDELEADGDMPTDGLPVLVTEGANPDPSRGWPDAMSASFVAAKGTMPILLTLADALPQVTADALAGGDVADATLIGGPVAISTTVEEAIADRVPTTRLSGDTRYGTGVAIVEQLAEPLGLNTDRVWLATGNEFVDGLVAGPAAARDDAILLLIDGANPDGATEVHTLLAELAPHRVVFVGGDAAIAPAVQAKVAGHQP